MKVYIAGPMTGIEEHNFPAFNKAAAEWRRIGWEVVNPAELDDPSLTHEELAAVPAEEYYIRDIAYLLGLKGTPGKCDAIALLTGWNSSKGARGEQYLAKWLGIRIFAAEHPAPLPITDHEFTEGTNECCTRPDYAHLRQWRQQVYASI